MDSDSDSSDTEIKPKIEDVLLFNEIGSSEQKQKKRYYGKKRYKNSKPAANVEMTEDTLYDMIFDNFTGQHFSGYVKYFKSNYKDSLDKSTKNSQKSIEARIKANELFTKPEHNAQIHKDIWELYCKSIAFAPTGSKELVLAYECRSNFLLHLKNYVTCVKDIDRALSITKFDLLKIKLLCRKMTCFVGMDKNTEEKLVLLEILNSHLKQVDVAFKDEKFSKMVEQAQTDSQTPPKVLTNTTESSQTSKNCETYIGDVKCVSGKEIRIIANHDFLPGEIVAMKRPEVTSFNPNKFYAYCSHCLSLIWAGIPCDLCTLCMYCSEECKADAWEKYHILECKILPHINIENIRYNNMHLSSRLFLKAMKEFENTTRISEKVEEIYEESADESKPDNNLSKSEFLKFYVLLTKHINNTKNCLDQISKLAVQACFLINCMIQTGAIFENKNLKSLRGKELAKDEDVVESAFLLLKILITMTGNSRAARQVYTANSKCEKYETGTECSYNRHCIIGSYYDTFDAKFEKSCNPNVARCWTNNGKIIYYCVQPIKKMEKFTICNYTEFFKRKKAERDKYCFFSMSCQCTACVKGWPVMKELFEKFKQRRLKKETKATQIADKYLKKNNSVTICVQEKNCGFNNEEYQQLLRDVNDVIKVCGQPSFASSLMINYLCIAFEKRYGAFPLILQVPPKC